MKLPLYFQLIKKNLSRLTVRLYTLDSVRSDIKRAEHHQLVGSSNRESSLSYLLQVLTPPIKHAQPVRLQVDTRSDVSSRTVPSSINEIVPLLSASKEEIFPPDRRPIYSG